MGRNIFNRTWKGLLVYPLNPLWIAPGPRKGVSPYLMPTIADFHSWWYQVGTPPKMPSVIVCFSLLIKNWDLLGLCCGGGSVAKGGRVFGLLRLKTRNPLHSLPKRRQSSTIRVRALYQQQQFTGKANDGSLIRPLLEKQADGDLSP